MRARRRARWFVGVVSLLAASGCVALSGLGDLEAVDEPFVNDSSADGAPSSSADGATTGSDASGDSAKDAPPFWPDVFIPADGDLPDVNLPDTGGPDAGPAGAGIVQCSGTLQCKNGDVCCFSAFFPFPGCAADMCTFGGDGLACDDDSDCNGSQMCCISSALATASATSSCKDSCGNGAMHACMTDADCTGANQACKHVANAPDPIKACQK